MVTLSDARRITAAAEARNRAKPRTPAGSGARFGPVITPPRKRLQVLSRGALRQMLLPARARMITTTAMSSRLSPLMNSGTPVMVPLSDGLLCAARR